MADFTLSIKGGERLDRRLRDLSRKIGTGKTLKIGVPKDAKYPDGTPVASVLLWNEFGTTRTTEGGLVQHVPPRPVVRPVMAENSRRWGRILADVLLAQNYNVANTLAIMGEGIVGQIKQKIAEIRDPPNAPATIAAKGFDKPLIDTGQMQNSITYEVADR